MAVNQLPVCCEGSIPLPRTNRDVVQPGRTRALGARSRWFESSHPDQWEVAQLVPLKAGLSAGSWVRGPPSQPYKVRWPSGKAAGCYPVEHDSFGGSNPSLTAIIKVKGQFFLLMILWDIHLNNKDINHL